MGSNFFLKSTQYLLNACTTDYRRPMKPFFHRNSKLLSLGRQFGQINFGAFGVFLANLSAPILVQRVPCPCFPVINYHFYKTIGLYIQIPNVYFELGFEFGPQRIKKLAIGCWQSVINVHITIGLPLDLDCLFTGCIIYHCFFTGCIIY